MWKQAFEDYSEEQVVCKHRELKLVLIEKLFESQQAAEMEVKEPLNHFHIFAYSPIFTFLHIVFCWFKITAAPANQAQQEYWEFAWWWTGCGVTDVSHDSRFIPEPVDEVFSKKVTLIAK